MLTELELIEFNNAFRAARELVDYLAVTWSVKFSSEQHGFESYTGTVTQRINNEDRTVTIEAIKATKSVNIILTHSFAHGYMRTEKRFTLTVASGLRSPNGILNHKLHNFSKINCNTIQSYFVKLSLLKKKLNDETGVNFQVEPDQVSGTIFDPFEPTISKRKYKGKKDAHEQ